jgi:hypothetical protein
MACAGPPAAVHAPEEHPAAAPTQSGVRLHGRIMELGRPALGIVVALYPPPPTTPGMHVVVNMAPIAMAVTDDDGCFVFREAVAPGRYDLQLESRRLDPIQHGSRSPYLARLELVLEPGERERRVDLGLH